MTDVDTSGIDPELLKVPVFQRVLADALEIQDRFSAKPVYARTGKGYLKSEGVEEIARVKEEQKLRRVSEPEDDRSMER